ncbi:MAG: hypothetical protein RIA08_04480 [Roseovarius sp.]|uniref:hypothetical protein n=1 Tax=Roseovarius sp. TaxID=1486281 RepID=UPI0032EED9E3
MSVLKTITATAVYALLTGTAGHAETSLANEATVCTGRLSAHLEHQWLMRDPAADQTEAARDAMAALLSAVGDGDIETLALRIEAKHAHAALLQQATFGGKATGGAAERRANRNIAVCTRLVAGYLDLRRDIHLPAPERDDPDMHRINADALD